MTYKVKIPDCHEKDSLISSFRSFSEADLGRAVYNSSEYTLIPGFCDVHVHFRQPGFVYKETVYTGSLAAARGGYSVVCTMPNLDPVPDCLENLRVQTDAIEKDSVIGVLPYGALTVGEKGEKLADMESIAPYVVAFSDDGRGVQDRDMMRCAMTEAKRLGKVVAAHCEVNGLLHGGYIHDGEYAKANGHRGICSESEWKMIERDIELAAETKCKYHVCHISTAESVKLIRDAKKSGVDVTCETAPHYLVLCDRDLQEDGRFKMNPPLRSARDRDALLEGICDGTVDMIATDHAPHSPEEKSRGLIMSPFGVVGLETAFPVMYTHLVRKNIISINKLISLMCEAPRARFGINVGGFSLWKLDEKFTVDSGEFLSMGRSTPFEGEELYGVNMLSVLDNKITFKNKNI